MLKSQISTVELIKKPLNGDVPSNNNDLPVTFEKPREPSEILKINVGGRPARLNTDFIYDKHPTGKLAAFCRKSHVERLTDCDTFFEQSEEYYFERSPLIFEYIIDFYITGKLHRPMDVCPIRLRYELDFWRIPISSMSPCCRLEEPGRKSIASGPNQNPEQVYLELSCPPQLFEKVWMGKQRLMVWTFFENPRSSFAAKVLSILSAFFVLASLGALIVSSMPEFQNEAGIPHWSLQAVELWQPLNIIDLLTIVPFIVEECLPLWGVDTIRNIRGAMIVIRVMRLARVARIFKLARYSIGLRAFGETMKKSAAELSMLGMFLLTGIMFFSTAIYFFERDEPNSKFYSIPAACWWCIVTMTTVGYGDLVPVTTGGKVLASAASVCGIIVLAFPISMIIDKFAESTGEWYGDDLVMNMPHHRRNDPKFKSDKRISSCGGQYYPVLQNGA
ncbi:hypothetical protein FO519_003192 [Halicephalobus sp. NKZ332]|nr:hypothetical protein FO519_003192 [Halicephalobus sp. NKZ332]